MPHLLEHPRLGGYWPGVPRRLKVRRLLLPRIPFSIAYVLGTDHIVIVAVAHARREPGYWLSRAERLARH